MNKVFLIGRLVEAPEQRQTPNGVSVATFRIAVNRRFNRDTTDYFTIVAWRGLADNCARYLVKGQQVAVTGELQTRSYEDRNGVRRVAFEVSAEDVEFLARPGGSGAGSGAGAPQVEREAPPAADTADIFAQEMGNVLMDDEDLPF